MKRKKKVKQSWMFYLGIFCACKKPKPEKKVITQTLTTSDDIEHPKVTVMVEKWCKKCGCSILEKKVNEMS